MKFTKHAQERCVERGFDESDVARIIEHGVVIKELRNKVYYRLGRCIIVCGRDGCVITVYRTFKENPKRILRNRKKKFKRNLFTLYGIHI